MKRTPKQCSANSQENLVEELRSSTSQSQQRFQIYYSRGQEKLEEVQASHYRDIIRDHQALSVALQSLHLKRNTLDFIFHSAAAAYGCVLPLPLPCSLCNTIPLPLSLVGSIHFSTRPLQQFFYICPFGKPSVADSILSSWQEEAVAFPSIVCGQLAVGSKFENWLLPLCDVSFCRWLKVKQNREKLQVLSSLVLSPALPAKYRKSPLPGCLFLEGVMLLEVELLQ